MSKRLLVEQKHTKAGIEFIKEGLEEFGIEKKQTIKTMLLVEEVLVKLREHAKDPDENICIILNKGLAGYMWICDSRGPNSSLFMVKP